MAKKKQGNLIGSWSFIIGVALAVIVGFFYYYISTGTSNTIIQILVFLGIIVGLLNVNTQESSRFILTGTVLVIISAMGAGTLNVIPQIGSIFLYLMAMIIPATFIVALKEIFELGKD